MAAGVLHPAVSRAADLSLPVTGNVVGLVVDAAGVPQMGATIQLLNKYHQAVAKVTSDVDGHFAFVSLPVDLYALQASLATFLPVSRDRITVKAGLDSVLQIHLATLVSSVEISYILPSAAMTDDWKWVLRSSPATRPINRYLPVDQSSTSSAHTPIFSSTHASLSLVGGEGGPLDSDSSFSDFGTAFALSTQVYGTSRLQVTGSFGEDNSATLPAVGISAIYSHNRSEVSDGLPEITFSATQISGIGALTAPNNANGPGLLAVPLRSMSFSIYEVADPISSVHVEYGATGESVDYLQHTNRVSPFARITADTGKAGQWIVTYSDGGRPDQLVRHSAALTGDSIIPSNDDPAVSLSELQRLPQVANRNGMLALQRARTYEVGYTKVAGSRTYAVSGFSEDVNDGRLNVAGNFSPLLASNILTDSLSRTSVYDVGRYRRTGYTSSVTQRLNGHWEAGLAYGRMGAFQAQLPDHAAAGQPLLRQHNANTASASLRGVVPRIGTTLKADYGWVDSGTVVPIHIFTSQRTSAAPGFNIYVRQPVPLFLGLPGRLEITADLRNLLSQGYLPLNIAGGRQMLIVQAPQSVRGGLNFIF